MKICKSTFLKIFVGIIVTTSVVISTIAYITHSRINKGFDLLITSQEQEYYKYGAGVGKYATEEEREQRHNRWLNEFEETVNTSIELGALAGLSIALIAGLILSKHITDPLNRLKQQLVKARSNNFQEIPVSRSTNEIQDLIVEFNKLVKELNRIEKFRDDLVSDIAHELKTPLTNIIGQTEGVIDGLYKADTNHMKKIVSNVKQLEYLISQLQNLTQIRSGQIDLRKQDINLKSLIDSIASNYDDKLLIKNNISKKLTIKADKNRLIEILDNLISNAIRHTKAGSITVNYTNDQLEIADTGEGIPQKDLPYIFERFYRVDKSRNKKTGGLGLGLTITKDLVEAHGWTITAKSKKGTGTTIIIKGMAK